MLVEAETARLAGGGEAYRVAVRIVAADKEASTELRAISEALTARFGGRAFTENARERDRAIVKTLVSTEERAKLETITPTFEAIRRLSQELLTIERRAMEKFVKETQPLLPAVTSHRNTVVDVARDAALAAPAYRKELESFAAVAPMIWREPVAAIKAVEQSMLKSERRDQLAGVIKSDPELFGQLRGSRRWIDRLTNAGAERKAALDAAEIASSHLRFAAPAFALEIEKATAVEEARRARMQVEVPRLSPQTAAALNGLAKTKDAMVFEAGVKALSEPVITELRAFEAALTKRLSPNVTARDQAAFASVPEANRKDFETARETLGIIARAVATDRQQRVAQQRIAENQQQSNKITR